MVENLQNLQITMNNMREKITKQDAMIRGYGDPKKLSARAAEMVPTENYTIIEDYYSKMTLAYEGRRRAREEFAARAARLRRAAV